MDHIGLQFAQQVDDRLIALPVAQRVYAAAKLGDDMDRVTAPLCSFFERSLRPQTRSGDQAHLIAKELMLVFDSVEGVLLRPADDEPGDEVDDSQRTPQRVRCFLRRNRPGWPLGTHA